MTKKKLSKNCPKLTKLTQTEKQPLIYLSFLTFLLFQGFSFYDFFINKFGFTKSTIFSRGHYSKTGDNPHFFIFLYWSPICVWVLQKKEKNSIHAKFHKVDPKVPLILKFFDPTSPMVGSNPTFSFWPSRGARGT